jgi:hypothetical protein
MYYNLICILDALLCGQNFILVKSGCYKQVAVTMGCDDNNDKGTDIVDEDPVMDVERDYRREA